MPTKTETDPLGFVRVTMVGAWPQVYELRGLRKVLDSSAENQRVLADIRGVTEEFPYYDEIRTAIDRVKDNTSSAVRRRAVLVGTDLQFGIARAFQSMLPGQVEVFRDEAAAVAWLLEGVTQDRTKAPDSHS